MKFKLIIRGINLSAVAKLSEKVNNILAKLPNGPLDFYYHGVYPSKSILIMITTRSLVFPRFSINLSNDTNILDEFSVIFDGVTSETICLFRFVEKERERERKSYVSAGHSKHHTKLDDLSPIFSPETRNEASYCVKTVHRMTDSVIT